MLLGNYKIKTTMSYHSTSIKVAKSKNLTMSKADWNTELQNSDALLVRTQNALSHSGRQSGSFHNANYTPKKSNKCTPRYLGVENTIHK